MAGTNLDLITPFTGTANLDLGSAPHAIDCGGANLCISNPRTPGDSNLAIGASEHPQHSATATADILLDDPIIDAVCFSAITATADVLLDEVIVDCAAEYLVNVWRGPGQTTASPHKQASQICHSLRSAWTPYVRMPASKSSAWQKSAALNDTTSSQWSGPRPLPQDTAAAWEQAASMRNEYGTRWEYPSRRRIERGIPWEQSSRHRADYASAWTYPPRAQTTRTAPFEQATPRRVTMYLPWDANPSRHRMETTLPWEQCRVLVSLWPRPDPYVPTVIPPRIITPDLDLHCPADGTASFKFGWICGGDGDNQIIIPIQRAYIVIHDIEVLRLPDNISIPASKIAISYDADSWAWGWSATLLGKDSLDAVLPSAQGAPVTLSVNINGYIWNLVVEEWSESREFGKRGVSVKSNLRKF